MPPVLLGGVKKPSNIFIHGLVLNALQSCCVWHTVRISVKLHHSELLQFSTEQNKLLSPCSEVKCKLSLDNPALTVKLRRKFMLESRSSLIS